MELKRFIIVQETTGEWLASVYAERYDAVYGHFYIGQVVVASTETRRLVGDSGGRTGIDQTLAMFAGCDETLRDDLAGKEPETINPYGRGMVQVDPGRP